MLFFREDLERLRTISQEEEQKEIQMMVQWVEELSRAGNFVSGEPLEPEGRLARPEGIVHNGPYMELKEGVSGFMIISAETIDQAAELAQACPCLGTSLKSVEVRPILKF